MTHRDELLSLQARVEAQQRELDEAKSEIELLRAAHARKTREAETLRRELEALEAGARTSFDPEPTHDGRPLRRSTGDEPDDARWSMRLGASVMAGAALVGSMMLAVGASRGACHRAPSRLQPAPGPAPLVTPLVREGRVVSTLGPEVVAVGETCTIERTPIAVGPYDCRIEVRCGEQTLYGATSDTGFLRCRDRELVRDRELTASDGDPAMTLDLARGRVLVEDRIGLGMQRVEIALDPVVD